MSKKLAPCPFCKGEARIIVCDDEGNHHSDDYEDDPWSGLGFMLYHDEENNPECPIAHDVYSECGRAIYDTREEAIAAWNRRAATEANEPLTLEVLTCTTLSDGGTGSLDEKNGVRRTRRTGNSQEKWSLRKPKRLSRIP